jgi:hypothetical protein
VIDFYIVILTISPFAALFPLMAEASRTGSFAWSFERKFTVPSDWYIGILLVLFTLTSMVLYFAFPVAMGTQTAGCYLLGLKVIPNLPGNGRLGLARGLRRVVLGFIGLCTWPFI